MIGVMSDMFFTPKSFTVVLRNMLVYEILIEDLWIILLHTITREIGLRVTSTETNNVSDDGKSITDHDDEFTKRQYILISSLSI